MAEDKGKGSVPAVASQQQKPQPESSRALPTASSNPPFTHSTSPLSSHTRCRRVIATLAEPGSHARRASASTHGSIAEMPLPPATQTTVS